MACASCGGTVRGGCLGSRVGSAWLSSVGQPASAVLMAYRPPPPPHPRPPEPAQPLAGAASHPPSCPRG